MKLEVQLKSVYGIIKVYPVNDAAKALADIAGTKTLELRIIKRALSGLGASVTVRGYGDAEHLYKMLEAA